MCSHNTRILCSHFLLLINIYLYARFYMVPPANLDSISGNHIYEGSVLPSRTKPMTSFLIASLVRNSPLSQRVQSNLHYLITAVVILIARCCKSIHAVYLACCYLRTEHVLKDCLLAEYVSLIARIDFSHSSPAYGVTDVHLRNTSKIASMWNMSRFRLPVL